MNIETKEEEKEQDSVVTSLADWKARKAVAAGRPPTGDNWLIGLEQGTVFLCRRREHSSPLLDEWHVAHKTDGREVLLYTNLNQEGRVWVDSLEFSMVNELVRITIHGSGNRTD